MRDETGYEPSLDQTPRRGHHTVPIPNSRIGGRVGAWVGRDCISTPRIGRVAQWLILAIVWLTGPGHAFGDTQAQDAQANTGASTNSPSANPAASSPRTNAPAGFPVRAYEVRGDTLLTMETLTGILAKYTGTNVSIADILKARSDLQMEYHDRGYATVKVTIPQQAITNGIVKFRVFEGFLAGIVVTNNNFFDTENVMRALPGLQPGMLLNRFEFQPELDRANANRDRQIYPEVIEGPRTNTSLLVLQVKDRLPLHERVELNNNSTPGTRDQRVVANISYDNLWQHEHSLGLQYGFSPEAFKNESVPGFPMNKLDTPQVSYYSIFYRAPLSSYGSVAGQVEQDPTQFGYNEATRRFNLPPSSGRPELSVYATRSTTDISTFGPVLNVTNTALFTIDNQRTERTVTRDYTFGALINAPLQGTERFNSSLTFGLDYKDHIGGMFPVNVFFTTITRTNEQGLPVTVTTTTPVPGTSTEQRYTYFLSSVGWNGMLADPSGITRAGFTYLFGLKGVDTDRTSFQNGAGSKKATGDFAAVRLRLAREQDLGRKWKLGINAEAQAASQPLVSLEQFGIGGLGSVRGYQEGELYGDDGWYTQVELRTPTFIRRDQIGGHPIDLGVTLSAFTDYGQVYLIDPNGRSRHPDLWGAGIAASVFFGPHFEGRFALAWPLLNSPSRPAGETRVTFAISGQF